MRFVKRILIGFGAASLLAIAAPAAANAAAPAAAPAQATTGSSSFADGAWGPYYSADHKAEAKGHYYVDKQKYKKWYWVKKTVLVKKCYWKNGKKHCKWVKTVKKKHVWKWDYRYFFKIHSTLSNYKWKDHPRFRCAWETFKVVNFDGHTYYRSFSNCDKHPADYSFTGKDAKFVYVKVARGGHNHPNGHYGPWQTVYSAV
ncbi:hypothetical protein HNP84_001707 [Thermocatellispora tengchongensis]|uniref:Uncharacterized protein n=1 Tax=Thermocatellispora tengchongensis TaxID=1073253 RepID=A0A840NTF7_9ACTN|nr:hypothetical protein [Thermocatellispora tengchongensis]MBB5131994.1 hypothetical protein [Thermocatellispora tengchongensis]